MLLLYKKFEINCMILCLPFDFLKNMCFGQLVPLVYKTQNDIYIIFKLYFKKLLILEYIILSIGIQQSITIIIM
jgi:hypothetical protein